MKPFKVKDCVLSIRRSQMPPAHSLHELRDRIALCSEKVLLHHVWGAVLRSNRENPRRGNDFSAWARKCLGDRELAGRLEIIDPYAFTSLEGLRAALLGVIDGRLSESVYHPSVASDEPFVFVEANLIVYDTGKRISRPGELHRAIREMSCGSIFYHFLDARRRPPVGVDDLSAWIAEVGLKEAPLLEALRSVSSAARNPARLRREIALSLAG
jgi:hypothetical protein